MAFALVASDTGITALDADGTEHPVLDGRRVTRLVRTAAGWWAAAEGGVLRRADDGTWLDIAPSDAELTCVLPLPRGGLAGTRDGGLMRLTDGHAERVVGFDDVDGRDDWHAVPSGVPYVRSMSATSDNAAICANVHVGGIPRSIDGGQTWAPTIDPEVDVHEVRAHSIEPAIVVAAAGYGFAHSGDAGATWTMTTDGLHASYCRAVAFTNDAVLVTASNGPFNAEGAVYRRAIGDDRPFEQCVDGLPHRFDGNVDTGCLDANGEDAVLVDAVGTVFASGDDGFSWFHVADIDAGASSVVLA